MSDKKAKGDKPEAETPEGEGAEAPVKKKLAGKTLVLFIILPALLVIGGGGAGAMMLLGGKKEVSAEQAELEHGEAHPPADKKKEAKKKDDGHGGSSGAAEGGNPDEVGWLTAGEEGDPSYWHMPKIIVNLSSAEDERPLFLELKLVLEAGESHTFDHVPVLMPRMKDQLQAFLRELRVEDLNGSAGSYRLRLELLKRFNLVMAPQKIDAVLIEGILIQ